MRNIIYLQFPQMSFRSSLVFSGCTRQQFVLLDTRKHQLEIKKKYIFLKQKMFFLMIIR